MAIELDDVDLKLLAELERDADRPNVELARVIGLSPAASLNRVRRLKESGAITAVRARLDPAAVGYPLRVHVSATLANHEEGTDRRFEAAVRRIPQVIAGDWVTGETDALLEVVARDVEELQRVLTMLSRAGAQRLLTLLRLRELKPASPLPLRPEDDGRR